MPELPEIEILKRHLEPRLIGSTIRGVAVFHPRSVRPDTPEKLQEILTRRRIHKVQRRGKFIVLQLSSRRSDSHNQLIIHLGMTGRLFLEPASASIRKHTTVSLSLGKQTLILKDMRKFGRFTVDTTPIDKLGPDPIHDSITTSYLFSKLQSSRQSIKVKLLDQYIIAGIGNIYAAEALFESRISPNRKADELTRTDCTRLIRAIKKVLKKSIRFGQGLDLDFAGDTPSNGLFYFGSHGTGSFESSERFVVYGREKKPCRICANPISKTILASRGTFWCNSCQPS